jgi:hypothetical protein
LKSNFKNMHGCWFGKLHVLIRNWLYINYSKSYD